MNAIRTRAMTLALAEYPELEGMVDEATLRDFMGLAAEQTARAAFVSASTSQARAAEQEAALLDEIPGYAATLRDFEIHERTIAEQSARAAPAPFDDAVAEVERLAGEMTIEAGAKSAVPNTSNSTADATIDEIARLANQEN